MNVFMIQVYYCDYKTFICSINLKSVQFLAQAKVTTHVHFVKYVKLSKLLLKLTNWGQEVAL